MTYKPRSASRDTALEKNACTNALPGLLREYAGYFFESERTIYLRSLAPEIVGHEFAHALDYVFGQGSYFSMHDEHICAAFKKTQWFVSAHAGSSVTAYFTEAVRMYFGIDHVVCRLRNVSVVFPEMVWSSFGSWLRTIRPGITSSEFVMAQVLAQRLPDFLALSENDQIFANFPHERQASKIRRNYYFLSSKTCHSREPYQ